MFGMLESLAKAAPGVVTAQTLETSTMQSSEHVNTSAQALEQIGLANLRGLQNQILDICIAAQRNGMADLSGKEIQQRYERQYGRRIEVSSVSARVNGLVTAKRLERVANVRRCAVTGKDIHPVRVPLTQARLVG